MKLSSGELCGTFFHEMSNAFFEIGGDETFLHLTIAHGNGLIQILEQCFPNLGLHDGDCALGNVFYKVARILHDRG